MNRPDDQNRGLSPLTIGLALGGSAVVWLVVEALRRFL